MKRAHIAIAALLVGMPAISSAVPIIREFGGNQDPASILGTVNQFRADLGNPDNLNNPGPLPSGRRELNWPRVKRQWRWPERSMSWRSIR